MALKPILGLFHGTTGSKLLRRSATPSGLKVAPIIAKEKTLQCSFSHHEGVNELSHDPSSRRLGMGELLNSKQYAGGVSASFLRMAM
eukprot:4801477-Amphidinium_carterae.1